MKNIELKPKSISENDIKRQIKEYLDLRGWWNFPILQSLGAYPGLPDRIAIRDGRILFLEIKRPKGKLSEHQKKFQENMKRENAEYYVIHNLEELMKLLEEK
jgi:hypothetical protein